MSTSELTVVDGVHAPRQQVRQPGRGRVELVCSSCGYRVSVAATPERCPMCGRGAWASPRHRSRSTGP